MSRGLIKPSKRFHNCRKCKRPFVPVDKENKESRYHCATCGAEPKRYMVDIFVDRRNSFGERRLELYRWNGLPMSYEVAVAALHMVRGEMGKGTFNIHDYSDPLGKKFHFNLWIEKTYTPLIEGRHRRGDICRHYYNDFLRYKRDKYIPFFRDFSVRNITTEHIMKFQNWLADKAVALAEMDKKDGQVPKLRKRDGEKCIQFLKKMLHDAFQMNHLRKMPSFPSFKRPDSITKWIDRATQDAVIREVEDKYKPVIRFICYHGARPGEVRALKWCDVDLETGIARIRRAFSRTQYKEFTKTGKERAIPLHPDSIADLRRLRVQTKAFDPDEFVFQSKMGRNFGDRTFNAIWHRARIKANVPNISLYPASRHSVGTQAAVAGFSDGQIGALLGHRNIATTKRYTHLQVEHLRGLIEGVTRGRVFELTRGRDGGAKE